MSRLNYRHLRYFWAIAHEGSLTRAAAQLTLSQSALSVQLGKLEQELGHLLFERLGKRLVLTEAGRIALDYADTVFQAGDELVSTMRGRPLDRRQPLRVGALTTLSRNFQLQFLQPVIDREDVELVLRSGTLAELLAQLEVHALDVILSDTLPRLDSKAGLRVDLLARQPVALVGRPGIAPASFQWPHSLRTAFLLLPSAGSEIRISFDRMVERAGIRLNILAEVDDMAMLRLLARESAALALVPPIVVCDELAAGVLVEKCNIPGLTESFYAITQRRRFPNPLLPELIGVGLGTSD